MEEDILRLTTEPIKPHSPELEFTEELISAVQNYLNYAETWENVEAEFRDYIKEKYGVVWEKGDADDKIEPFILDIRHKLEDSLKQKVD